MDELIDLPQRTLEVKLLDKDKGQSEADFFGFGLLLFGKDEPLLGIGEHFLLLE